MSRVYQLMLYTLLPVMASSQTTASLLRDIEANGSSYNGIRKIFNTYEQVKGWQFMNAWFVHPYFCDRLIYLEIDNPSCKDSNYTAKLYTKKDRIIGLTITRTTLRYSENKKFPDTVYRYIDSAYTRKILKKKNRNQQIFFNYADLFEIDYPYLTTSDNNMLIVPRFERPSQQLSVVFEMVRIKDSSAIIRHARSFYAEYRLLGAAGLYTWSKINGPLDVKANKLLEKIQRSRKKVIVGEGCLVSAQKLGIYTGLSFLEHYFKLYGR